MKKPAEYQENGKELFKDVYQYYLLKKKLNFILVDPKILMKPAR